MPRPNKRPAADFAADCDDPLHFVQVYCKRRNIAFDTGASPVEKMCHAAASHARDEFKRIRNACRSDRSPAPDRTGLTPAQKYTIRLQNNRRSASASKVYTEILKREHAHRLVQLSMRVAHLQRTLDDEKARSNRLLKRLLQDARVSASAASQQPAPSTPLHQRFVNSRAPDSNNIPPCSLSPVALHHSETLHHSDAAHFHTGLTCSQSQDLHDKHPVSSPPPNHSLPMSPALQIPDVNSQPTQELPPFKPLNSDELVPSLPPSDFFTTSQPLATRTSP
ncbi:unnamed protein product [Agarophyton chilense]|eukprot:gb/GEZJ01001008.1/.p1 GENE.gb/GEZJ01001008.1/~~gb/GEZJ01001008.1/.p1  ORF type:complete len:304 (-),score=48.86 gb/GEZJ01001008.1/:448-1284(-)